MSNFADGVLVLLKAAQTLGDHPGGNRHPQERNDLHEYARSPPEQPHCSKDLKKDPRGNDRVRVEPKERQRPGGRMEHNRLEKDRRAQMKKEFQKLHDMVPTLRDRKQSTQAILRGTMKYIEATRKENMKMRREVQRLSEEKIRNTKNLEKAKREFEERTGIPADRYLSQYMNDEVISISTLSATEGPDNLHDFDDMEWEEGREEDGVAQVARDSAPSSLLIPAQESSNGQLRGIPHSVIKPVPGVNHRPEAESNPAGVPRETLQKVQAMITTKQPPAVQDMFGRGATQTGTIMQPVTVPASMAGAIKPPQPPPTLMDYSAALAGGNVARLPLSRSRPVGHSLLTHTPSPLLPIYPPPTSTVTPGSMTSIVVPSSVQASPTILHPYQLRAPFTPVGPHVIVAAAEKQGAYFVKPRSIYVMPSHLASQANAATVTSHVAL